MLTGGSFTDPLNGIRLTGIEGRVTGRGDSVVVERLTAATRNGGRRLGRRAASPSSPTFPGNFHVTAEQAELVSSPLMTAVSSVDLTLSGPLARTPRIAGRVDVVSIDVAGSRTGCRPRSGRCRACATSTRRRRCGRGWPSGPGRKAATAPGRRPKKPAVPFDATLDVAVDAPSRIFVRGRGIDAELGGALRVTGTSAAPNAVGAFAMRRGRLELVGQRLDFSRGTADLRGQPDHARISTSPPRPRPAT